MSEELKKQEETEELLNSEISEIEGGGNVEKTQPSQDWCDTSCLIACSSGNVI